MAAKARLQPIVDFLISLFRFERQDGRWPIERLILRLPTVDKSSYVTWLFGCGLMVGGRFSFFRRKPHLFRFKIKHRFPLSSPGNEIRSPSEANQTEELGEIITL
jgi:hypothetical protein